MIGSCTVRQYGINDAHVDRKVLNDTLLRTIHACINEIEGVIAKQVHDI